MNRSMMMGLVTGGLLGATVGMYAVSNMSPKDRKKAMRRTRKMLSKAVMMNVL
ncbi:YtxH domain-containing protein [Alkaliphilus peptidifermentans]|uniref:YtxH-like protein n=1 Tax=Alkaliphilus peptidifermentans DSM 18978 TaxID=1120976 RepID=A0A1G5H3M4_9FIRM|nr:YtxH domain-containing protein [Alkaliphilus peptidifermentans]SCY58261.1 hypothetical protein SAMN03080606_01896 [Alkaliphilus peptidifermentans DSM 18978]